MNYTTRKATPEDEVHIFELYREVAKHPGGIAREMHEITQPYIHTNLKKSMEQGISLLAISNDGQIVGEIHGYQMDLGVFSHVFSNITIVVHPKHQGLGVGKLLFTELLQKIEDKYPNILRVELIVRESNKKAIEFYKKIGFSIEGRFEKRIKTPTGDFEADIPMGWFNKNFTK